MKGNERLFIYDFCAYSYWKRMIIYWRKLQALHYEKHENGFSQFVENYLNADYRATRDVFITLIILGDMRLFNAHVISKGIVSKSVAPRETQRSWPLYPDQDSLL